MNIQKDGDIYKRVFGGTFSLRDPTKVGPGYIDLRLFIPFLDNSKKCVTERPD